MCVTAIVENPSSIGIGSEATHSCDYFVFVNLNVKRTLLPELAPWRISLLSNTLSKLGSHQPDPGSANTDRGAPTFDGDMKAFREHRKRAESYQLKNKVDQEIGLSLMSGVSGNPWDVIEHVDVPACSPKDDKNSEGADSLVAKPFKELDAPWRYDKKTELPSPFTNFFYKGGRKPRGPLSEYFTRVPKLTRSIKEHGTELPDEIQGWLLLFRRAAFRREDRIMTMSRISEMKLETVVQALMLTFGQDAVPDARPSTTWKRSRLSR